MFPMAVAKRAFKLNRAQSDKPKLTLQLGDYVHPSLAEIAEKVEYFIHRFQLTLETTLVRIDFVNISMHTKLSHTRNFQFT